MSAAVCLHFQLFVYFFVSWLFTFVSCLFTIWIFAPKSLVFHQSFVKIMLQSLTYVSSSLFTFSAVCLLFRQLIVYFCQLFVYTLNFRAQILGFPPVFCQNNASKLDICQQFVYIFSCLFTFSSADCLLLSADFSCLFTSCQLIFEFLRKNHVFLVTFLPLQMLQHFVYFCQLFCLHFQLFVYNFSCLFTFCQLKSAVCLLLVSWFLNFCAKIMFFGHFFATTDASTL